MGAWAICYISLMCRDEVNVLIDTRIKIFLDVENLLPYLKFTGNSLWLALNYQVIPTNLHVSIQLSSHRDLDLRHERKLIVLEIKLISIISLN